MAMAFIIHHLYAILDASAMQSVATEPLFGCMQIIPMKKYFGTWESAKVSQQIEDMLRVYGCVVNDNHPI